MTTKTPQMPKALRKRLIAAFDNHEEGGHPVGFLFFDSCANTIWQELAPLLLECAKLAKISFIPRGLGVIPEAEALLKKLAEFGIGV